MAGRGALLQYKGNHCTSCGLSVQEMLDRYGTFERMFEFHHVDPTGKDTHYRRLMAQRLSRRQLDEIDKCVLLCRHCHGVLHAQNIRAHLTLSIDFRDRIVSQTVPGWIKVDRLSKAVGFVTNERYTLHPCRVTFADRPDLRLTAGEIGARVVEWMQSMESIKALRVYRLRDDRNPASDSVSRCRRGVSGTGGPKGGRLPSQWVCLDEVRRYSFQGHSELHPEFA